MTKLALSLCWGANEHPGFITKTYYCFDLLVLLLLCNIRIALEITIIESPTSFKSPMLNTGLLQRETSYLP